MPCEADICGGFTVYQRRSKHRYDVQTYSCTYFKICTALKYVKLYRI